MSNGTHSGRKKISVVGACYNEAENLCEFVERVFTTASKLSHYDWECIIIDNNSTDGSRELIRELIKRESRLRSIFNTTNFGHIRSPYYGLLQGQGDAVVLMASDLQDPPELIEQFISHWEKGYKITAAIKSESEESPLFFMVRKTYYKLIANLSEAKLLSNFTGFGLYDQSVVQKLREMDNPYPYLRGMIAELGYPVARVQFKQPRRKRGFTKNNFYTLYDMAMLGFTSHTKAPLRLATMAGFACAFLSFATGLAYLFYKLLFWREFSIGMAPIVVGLFFLGSIQLLFIGILGEYIGAIHTKVTKRPLVVESERINF